MASSPENLAQRVSALEAVWDTYGWWPSFIISAFTLAIILFGLASFAYFRFVARRDAERVAERTAQSVAERSANDYLQRNIDDIVRQHVELVQDASVEEGDRIAEEADEGHAQ